MNKLATTGIASATFVGGFVLASGLVGLAGEVPEVQTRTERVEVEVPGPEVIKEVKVPVATTPQACHDAIASAERLGLLAGEGFISFADWPPLVSKAFSAGLEQNPAQARRVLGTMERLTEETASLTSKVEAEVARFNEAKAQC